jgi:hypothetical protein
MVFQGRGNEPPMAPKFEIPSETADAMATGPITMSAFTRSAVHRFTLAA